MKRILTKRTSTLEYTEYMKNSKVTKWEQYELNA